MGREVRRVPRDWQHPRDDRGNYIPLRDGDLKTAAEEWLWELIAWEAGSQPGRKRAEELGYRYLWQWDGPPPCGPEERGGYMYAEPRDDLTHLMLYESTSEGTPLSPAFETLEEVAEWAADNATTFADFKATRDEWLAVLSRNFVHHTENRIDTDGKSVSLMFI